MIQPFVAVLSLHGHGDLAGYMCNLFAYRATHPEEMKRAEDPVGSQNDAHILETSGKAGLVVAMWGNQGDFAGRSQQVARMVKTIHCLKRNKSGAPAHPLYLPRSLRPVRWEPPC